jgi:hypothetical protein
LKRKLHVVSQAVIGRQFVVSEAEADFVEMGRNDAGGAFDRRNVGTRGDMLRIERAVGGGE